MLLCPWSMLGHKTLIAVINQTTIQCIQMLTNGRIEQSWMPRYCVVTNISWNMLFDSNLKTLGSVPYIFGITATLNCFAVWYVFSLFLRLPRWLRRGCSIHQLHFCRVIRRHLIMTLKNMKVHLQKCWSFGECRVPRHCYRSKVHTEPEWYHLTGKIK